MDKPRSKKTRKVLIALLIVLLIPLLLVGVAVQPFFIRTVVFPRIEAATETSIEIETFSFSPFSRITAENGRIHEKNGEFDLEFDSMLIRYDLIRILRGNPEVHQFQVVRPNLRLRLNTERETTGPEAPEAENGEVSDLRILLRDLEIVEGRVTLILPGALVELSDLQLQIPEIRNGEPVRPRFEASLRGMHPDNPDSTVVAGMLSSTMDIGLSENLRPVSFAGGFKARIRHEEFEERELRMEFHSDFGMNVETQSFQVRSLSGDAQLGGTPIMDVRLLSPVEVNASEVPIRLSDTDLQFDLGPFELAELPFSELLPIQAAKVELRSRLEITGSGQRMGASAQFDVRDMTGELQGVDLSDWAFSGNAELSGTTEKLEWSDARVLVRHKGAQFLDVSSSGNTRPPFEEGDATIQFAPIPLNVAAQVLPNFPFKEGTLSGDVRFRWTAGPEVSFRAVLEGNGLTLEGDNALPSPLELNVVAAVKPESMILRTARFAWPATRDHDNQLTASGTVDFGDLDAVEARLEISGERLDVSPFYFPPTEKEAASGESPLAASVPEELKLPPLPLKPSTLSLRVAEIRLDDLLIRDLTVDARAERQRIEVKPLNFRLNESEFTSEIQFDWSEALAAYELRAEMTPLNIQPVVDSLLPEKAGKIAGLLEGGMSVSGKGTTWSLMREHLRGDLSLSLREGRFKGLDVSERIIDGNVMGTTRIRLTAGPEVDFQMHLEGDSLVVDGDKALPSPLRLDVAAAATPDVLILRNAEIAWPPSEKYSNKLEASGTVDFSEPDAVEARLEISGDRLDVKPWYLPPKDQEPVSGESPVTASVPEELKLPPLPLKPSTLSLRVAEIRLDELVMRDLIVDTRAERQRIEVKPLNFRLNESEFRSQIRFDWSEALAAYELRAEMTPLNIQPIADSLLPEKAGAVTGLVEGAIRINGQGTIWSSLREHLRAEVNVSLREGQLRLLDPNPDQNAGLVHTRNVVRRILTALALALNLPPEQLMAPPLDQVVFRSRMEPGTVHVERFETMNTEFYLESHGRIALAELMENSGFETFPVVVGLNTNLAKRARIYREDRVKEGRVLLPSFLSVKGTVGEPEVDVNRSVVTGLVLTGVTERNDIGNERVQGILQGLGGILSGEGPPPPAPTPTPAPAEPGAPPVPTPPPSKTDQVLEGLRIFRELRATPTPAPRP